MPRRPAVGLVCCYVLGTWAGLRVAPAAWWPAFAGVVAVVALSWLALRLSRRVGLAGVYVSVALVAWLAVGVRPCARPSPVPFAVDADGGLAAELTGIVAGDVTPVLSARTDGEILTFRFRVESIARDGDVRSWPALVKVRWYAWPGRQRPAYGQRWVLGARLRGPSEGYRGRLRYSAFTGPGGSRCLSSGHGWQFFTGCYAARRSAAAQLAEGIADSAESVSLLQALLLGYRAQLAGPTRLLFTSTGTFHVFAISGLHVGIFCGLMIFALRAARVSRVRWILFVAPLLAGYTVATGAKPSAVRACAMAIVYLAAPLFGRRADSLSSLAVAALVVLAAKPGQLNDAGFIFSFIVVAGLIAMCPLFYERLARGLQPDPLRLDHEPLRVRVLRGVGRGVAGLAAVAWSAWLVSAPLTAFFFGRLTLIAPLSNLFVVPLVFMIVVSGCLSLVLGACIPWLGITFNHANLALIGLTVKGLGLLQRVPYGSLAVAKPPVWAIGLWYALLAAWVLRWRRAAVRGAGNSVDSAGPE